MSWKQTLSKLSGGLQSLAAGSLLIPGIALLTFIAWTPAAAAEEERMEPQMESAPSASMEETRTRLQVELGAGLSGGQAERLARGMEQVAALWRPEDGGGAEFAAFVRRHFAADPESLDEMFERFEVMLEQLDGHLHEIQVAFRLQSDLDRGPIRPFDEIFAAYAPEAHVLDDFFANRLAFVVLLNFPLTTLDERLTAGDGWSRRQWAEARLAQRFGKRIPAEANLALARAASEAAQYVAGYNLWMHHLLDGDGRRLFPPGMRLLSHWNLRDEIKAAYADPDDGFAKQRLIQRAMERIVTQTIPAVVVDNPHVDWSPASNQVAPAAVEDAGGAPPAGMAVTPEREPDTRYAMLLATFRAGRRVDPYSPAAPTLIARRFDEEREIPEERVRAIFHQLLASPLLAEAGRLVEARLGRPLEPFDIWYGGFRPGSAYDEARLDAAVRERYPTPESYARDIPRLLAELGFPPERARVIAADIVVEPARGSGHAWGAAMRQARSRLRTRVGQDGMDYKGFNIAVHEMGHNVEQVISLDEIDHTLLAGVPNTAFTEALAFVFQARDLELLGLASPRPEDEALQTLATFWNAAEIAAVALVDMEVWHWMYDHPEAGPAELREATLAIAREVWNRTWAPVIGRRDSVLLAVYSHMIDSFLYLPDYPLGYLIAYQIEEQVRQAGAVGPEFERMAKAGRLTPDLWMQNATGRPVGPEALLAATRRALDRLAQPAEAR